ncbi:MAG: UbiA family prenyltransferase, partial [Saprospiraceae bacterium]
AIPFILIYPLAVALLYFYSKKFKKQTLTGNFTVAFFCAGVAGIILLMERNSFSQLSENAQGIINSAFLAYAAFAYLSTIFREIVKDIEDMDGDKERGCKTFPITSSVSHAKFFAISHLMILVGLVLFISLSFFQNAQILLGLYGILLLIAPSLFMILKLIKAENKKDYHFVSQMAKGVMLFGLLFLPLYYVFS